MDNEKEKKTPISELDNEFQSNEKKNPEREWKNIRACLFSLEMKTTKRSDP